MSTMRSVCEGMAVLLVVSIMAAANMARAAEPATASIGVAQIDITPETPVRMYGYGARKTESEGIAGRLKAGALAIGSDDAPGPAILLAVDCGAVPGDIRAEVLRRAGAKTPLRSERFVLCNAHNHSGPDLKGMAELSGKQYEHLAQYKKELTDRLVQVVAQALAARQPCRMAWSEGSVGFAANRRVLKDGVWRGFGAVPGAPVDHSLPLLQITAARGKLMAVVVDYACHNTTLRGNFKQIHGDWAQCARECIEADHPGAVALITIGCGADADPCPHSTVELCQKHGRAMADEVSRVLRGPMKPLEPKIVARTSSLEIAYREAPSLDEMRAAAKRAYPVAALLKMREQGAKPPVSECYPITTWVLGSDLAMVFLPHEVVVDYATRMKREMDGSRLWINAYCNDVSNYVVSERLIREGGYEVNNSLSAKVTYGQPQRLQPSMEERIIGEVKRMLPEEFRRR